MTTFFLIRHGNIDYCDKIPGRQSGIHLSNYGHNQARSLVERFGKVAIDAIFSSPLERTIETATPISKIRNCPVQIREDLDEIDFGEWTGKSFDELENNLEWKQFHYYRNGCWIPEGEYMINVQLRMVKSIYEIYRIFPEHNVLIFSHNDPIKSVIAYFGGISLDQFLRVTISTGSVSAISMIPNDVKILFINATNEILLTS